MRKRKKLLSFLAVAALVLLIAGEVLARYVVGLGDPPLYRTDEDYEYIQVANQDLHRFGIHYQTNEFSMRSKPLTDQDAVRILKIGDSVINGGALTDNDSLASTRLENRLSEEFNSPIRVLNLSSGSWGPDNAAAFLKKHGDFDANIMVLVFSSHDYYDAMTFKGIVGQNPSFPNHKPVLALWEGFTRYVLPRIFKRKGHGSKINGAGDNRTTVNPGWAQLAQHAHERQIPILAVVHPTKTELKAGALNEDGQHLLILLDSLHIPVFNEIEGDVKGRFYRDDIHYNEGGQRFLAAELFPWLKERVEETLAPSPVTETLVRGEGEIQPEEQKSN